MNYQISVIVPLYNIKWNLFKFCLDSILSQLNNNIELLIINDGSKERESVDCCKKYIKKYFLSSYCKIFCFATSSSLFLITFGKEINKTVPVIVPAIKSAMPSDKKTPLNPMV